MSGRVMPATFRNISGILAGSAVQNQCSPSDGHHGPLGARFSCQYKPFHAAVAFIVFLSAFYVLITNYFLRCLSQKKKTRYLQRTKTIINVLLCLY